MYLIEILHQTTTCYRQCSFCCCCILSKFYIKPQQRVRHKIGHSCCILSKFYIKPQPSVRVRELLKGCILSKFYIKPQPLCSPSFDSTVVSYRNSTSNHNCRLSAFCGRFVVSYRNSTSNHNTGLRGTPLSVVVSYRNSTSNHNYINPLSWQYLVVSYRNSTSNHNQARRNWKYKKLYLIEILHQTTTSGLILIDKVLLTGCLPL